MSRFAKRMKRRKAEVQRDRIDRRKHAEEYVFRYLERRWAEELGGRRIPTAFRKRMRSNPAFNFLVGKRLAGQPLVMDDLEQTPTVERRPDGKVRSRMAEELGGDPTRYYCGECESEEVESPGEVCAFCRKILAG